MKIESKRHSAEVIKKLKLNGVPEIVCYNFDKQAILNFCAKYVSNTYILRDVENPSGQYYLCKSANECVENAKNYSGAFSLGVSCFAYSGVVLLGEILLKKDSITLVARNDDNAHHRNIYENPAVNLTTTLEDDKLWETEGSEKIIKYVVEHSLYDVVVEFVVYNHPVGVNNENVLIVELRSEY